jgi:hypothetical protein
MLLDMKGVRNGDQCPLCSPTLYIDLLERTVEVEEVLYNNYIPTNLHLDTRTTSWNKIRKDLDLLHVSKQAH